jgi:hypothetical protein
MATPHLLGTGQFNIEWESLYGEHGVNAALALRGTLSTTRFLPGAALTVSVRVKAQGRYDLKLWIAHPFGDATYLPR